MLNILRTARRIKTDKITRSWSNFSRIWMKPKCNLPPKWSARRRSLSWRPRYAEQTSHTRSFCCWKLDAGIEFRYSSWRKEKKKTGKCQGVLTQPQPSRVIPAKTYTAAIRDHKSTLIIKEVPYKTLCKRSCPAGLSLLVTSDQIFQRKNCLPLQVISLHQINVSKELFFCLSHYTANYLPAHCRNWKRRCWQNKKRGRTCPAVYHTAQPAVTIPRTPPYLCLFLFCSDFFHFHQDLLRLINISFSSQLLSFS